jgi:Arc/MetJ family transcription regulator
MVMRTTLTLDDDVLAEAARRAEALHISIGKAVSDLARRGCQAMPVTREVDGLVVFDPPKGAPKISARRVKDALSEFP